ncbi:MAG: hypothetical protein ABSH46_20215 [Bryobacteraceae bacterium]|jgi:hypothetical protein
MKRLLTASVLGLALFSWSALAEDLTGVFTCSKCKHTDASGAECAKHCIKNGVAPIFVTSDGKTLKVANPDKVGDKIAEKVTVTGSVEGDTLTIESVN